MKTLAAALLATALFTAAGVVNSPAQTSPDCGCPSAAPDPSPAGNGNGSGDPAFVMPDAAASVAKQRNAQSLLAGQTLKKPAELVVAEQTRYQTFLQDIQAHPAQSYGFALGVWRENGSGDLQRLAILQALSKTRSSEESGDLQFMLKAMSDAAAQRQECLRLGRGNSLEKAIAARRLLLLEENPGLQSALAGK